MLQPSQTTRDKTLGPVVIVELLAYHRADSVML